MEQAPEEMTLADLDVLVMPNGEILCVGISIGYVDQLGKRLHNFKSAINGKPVDERGNEI